MYTSFTLAIPVENPKEVAFWYKEYLALPEVQVMDNDVYEIQIMSNLWLQFYSVSDKYCDASLILRIGVDELDKIVREFKQTGRKVRNGKKMQGIRYIYSEENPWGQKIGFYELLNGGEKYV